MLLTDGNLNTIDDLRVYESAVAEVAHTEMIDLTVKLDLAAEEVAQDILDFLLDRSGADPQAAGRRRIGVSDVTVTRQLRRWHAVHALEIFYRDAFNNQLNDRYQAKFREYQQLTRNAREHTFHFGVGLALTPIPQAPPPALSAVAGPFPKTVYYVRASWTGAEGQEGAPSEMTTYDAPAGALPVVQMTNPPAVASGFNVYMGLTPDAVTLQNDGPVPIGQSFVLPGTGLVQGRVPGDGQPGDIFVSGVWVLQRG
ncbi:MAG TPA: hypothetical protein VLN48_16600 [Bryobacteraceae bacterium]|nr:hypothetical protein [Bryobacteraceae bacterium]